MKRMIISLIVALPAAMAAETATTDTTFVLGNKHITVCDSAGKTNVRINTDDGKILTRTYETEYTGNREEKRVYVKSIFFPDLVTKKPCIAHYPILFLGINTLGGSVMSPGGSTGMHSRDSKSWEWGLTLTQAAFRLAGNTAINVSLNIGQVHHHFQGNYVLATSDGKTFMRVIEDAEVKKSYVSYATIRVPIIFEWQNRINHKSVFAGIGASLEYRTNDYSRYFIGKKKYTSAHDINIAPLGVNMEAYMGVGPIVIYGRAGLTPLLKKSNAPECYTFAAGIGFTI